MLIGCDTGGTFTDFVMFDPAHPEAGLTTLKLSSTPDDPSRAVLDGVRRLCGDTTPQHVNHGTTVATNALLESSGGRVAFFVTEGFKDMLWLGRGQRNELYALAPTKTAPPLNAEDCFEVAERMDAQGRVIKPLQSQKWPLPPEVTAAAICFLHASHNPTHELELKQELPDIPIFCSHEVAAGSGEYERGITTLLAAYLSSKVGAYLDNLSTNLEPAKLMVVHSAGGLLTPTEAKANPHRLALSGPAGGLRGALAVGLQCNTPNLVTLDMGGTSTDVALLHQGELPYNWQAELADLPLRAPTLEIHTIGAGGGSIAKSDLSGILRVGPQSSGAQPGPACYGRGGTEPTITDALCFNGFLPETLGDEDWPVQREKSKLALQKVAASMGLNCQELADGILAVATEHLAGAVRKVTTACGHDPGAFTLFPFGGAGPLLACSVAESLEINRILIPQCAGVLSAWGALTAPWEREWSESLPLNWRPQKELWMRALGLLKMRARKEFEDPESLHWTKLVSRRYQGQGEVLVSEPDVDFHELHRSRFGFHRLDHPVEATEVRLRASRQAIIGEVDGEVTGAKKLPTTTLRWKNEELDSVVWSSVPNLSEPASGPLLIFDKSATIFVAPTWKARTLNGGHLLLERDNS